MAQIRDVQVICKVHVTGRPGHQRKTGGHKDGWHNGQAIQTVGQVNGVTGTDNHKVGQQDVEQPQLWHHVLKERHDQLGGWRVFACQIQREGHAQRNHRHPEVFPAGDQALGVFTHDLAVIINKPNDAVAHQHGKYAPDVRVRGISPQQYGTTIAVRIMIPPMVGVPRLLKCDSGPSLRTTVTEGEFLQTGNHARAHPQRDEQRSQQADNGAKRQIGKDVKAWNNI